MFLRISQNSQENICARVSFLKVLRTRCFTEHLQWLLLKLKIANLNLRPGTEAWNFIKKETLAQVFSWEFCEIFKEHLFIWNTFGGCFYFFCIVLIYYVICSLTHFWSMFPFYSPWKHQKTFGFPAFSAVIK